MKLLFKAGILLILIPALFSAGCTDSLKVSEESSLSKISEKFGAERVELYHFHTSRQCYTCVLIEKYANETVHTFYGPQLESGRLVYKSLNIDLSENSEITEKYGPAGTSLWIGVYGRDGEFYKEELVTVWYKTGDPETFSAYLRGILDPLTGGAGI